MSPGNRPAVPTVTAAPPGALDPGWAQAVTGVLDDPSRHRLAFQPVADLQRGTVAGYEALSRFAGPPDAGPDVWFEAAGRLGLGAELDARVLERVVGLRPELPPNCFLTVNLDPNHLVTEPVQRALAAAPSLAGVVVELTEHRPVADYPMLVAAVAELRLRDAKLAVDDAGAGYAGLQHLMLLRPDLVKLDRALVAGCDRDPAKAALIEMLGRFTGQLDAWVLAEGIERMAELESLIRLRVPLAQGYLLGRPAEPWAALPDGLAGAIRDKQTAQTFEDSVVGLTVDAPAVRAGDAVAAAAGWFDADHELDVVVVLDDWSRPVGWSTGPVPPATTSPSGPCSRPGRRPRPRRWWPGPWPARPPTASTRWSASTTGATTWECSASSSSCTGSWPAPAPRRRCGSWR
jgi:EAL domain-containing protein (putative c-di-GMP-specific phosphodiesterase class I)